MQQGIFERLVVVSRELGCVDPKGCAGCMMVGMGMGLAGQAGKRENEEKKKEICGGTIVPASDVPSWVTFV